MALFRAVVYCRCSTEEESQVDALNKQVLESEACVREQGWILVDRYVESKSGTTTKGRNEYKRLYEDLLDRKFDVIVIKSQDRLMRNVKDWYLFLDRMLTQKKRLFMYLEGKFYTADDALITGIKAILAEEYSRELSKKINNAHRHRQKNGEKAMLTSRVFGFCRNSEGLLMIEEEEAEIIRKIYGYCAVGYGSRRIADIFFHEGYVKRTGGVLTAGSVRKIIRNPLYKGMMVMNRRHYDFETKRIIVLPKKEWIYREGMVPAIVDDELWEQANRAMDWRAGSFERRREIIEDNSVPSVGRISKIGRYDLSGKLICAKCGKPYYRTRRRHCKNKKNIDQENLVVEWKCSNYLERGRKRKKCPDMPEKEEGEEKFSGGCNNVHLEESIIFSLLEQICRQYDYIGTKDSIICRTVQMLEKVLNSGVNRSDQEGMREGMRREEERLYRQKDFLLTKFLEGVIADKDYRKKNDELEERLRRLRLLQLRKEEGNGRDGKIKSSERRMGQIKARLENGGVEKAAAAQLLEHIREIRVHEWQMELCFDSWEMLCMQDTFCIPDTDKEKGYLPAAKKVSTEDFTLWVDYPFPPETERGRYLERRRIMELMEKEPSLTAKEIAGRTGHSVYMVRNRIAELTEAGYLRFDGRGGQGAWETVKKLPDKEEAFRDGGL